MGLKLGTVDSKCPSSTDWDTVFSITANYVKEN